VGEKVPRLQLLTVGELLAGKQIEYKPVQQASVTFKQAPRHRKARARQIGLEMGEE